MKSLKEQIAELRAAGYKALTAQAKVAPDAVLLAMHRSGFKLKSAIKGGVVMSSITGDIAAPRWTWTSISFITAICGASLQGSRSHMRSGGANYRGCANGVRSCFFVMKARMSADGRGIWLVCDPHTSTYFLVCRYDFDDNTFRVFCDGDTIDEQPDGTILIKNRKTYLQDGKGEPLGAAWYGEWIAPDGKVVRKSKPISKSE